MNGKRTPSLVGPAVHPGAITFDDSLQELIEECFASGVGRQFRDFMRSLHLAIAEEHTLVWCFAGILTPSGYSQSCLAPLMRAGLVHAISTTNANIYHDVGRWWPTVMTVPLPRKAPRVPPVFEVDPRGDDRAYARRGIVRIYDVAFHEDIGLYGTDLVVADLSTERKKPTRPISTAEYYYALGRRMIEQQSGPGGREPIASPSLTVLAAHLGIPIFSGEFFDGSIGLNLVHLQHHRKLRRRYLPTVDTCLDVETFASLMHHSIMTTRRKMTIVIIGGGVPKNYGLQIGPYLTQICGLPSRLRYTSELQICDAPVDNGSLSSAPASEAFTWDKVDGKTLDRNVYVRGDWTVLLPLVTRVLVESGASGDQLRLVDKIGRARTTLARAVSSLKR